MLTWLGSRQASEPATDLYELHAPRFAAFLDQARWLLAEQQRRGATFQQAAMALIGIDGVLLALLVGNDTLRDVDRYSAAWWSGIFGALLFVASAVVGLVALKPTGIYSQKTDGTIYAWSTFLREGGEKRDTYHFAHMLLDADPPVIGPQPGRALRNRMRKALGLSEPPTQPLLAAEHLATHRGKITSTSGALLLGGIVALLVFLFVVPPTDTQSADPKGAHPSENSPAAAQLMELR